MRIASAMTRLERRLAALLVDPRPRPSEDALRVQVTILATLLFAAVGFPLALRCWVLGATAIAGAVMGLMALGMVNVLALRRATRVTYFAHAAVSLLVSLFVVAGLCSGGFYDPAFSWMFVAPLLAFLLTGLHGGWAWTAIVGGITVAFWACAALGVDVPSLVPPPQRSMQGLTDRLSNLTGLAAVATAFLFARKRVEHAFVAEIAERRRAEEEAIAGAIAKTSFLAHMSHEIRTPMVGILGASELLLQTSLSNRQQGLAATIETSTRNLLGILNNVLDLSRIDAGRLTVALEPVDARLVCEDVAELLATPAASRGIDLVVAWSSAVPRTVVADPLRLRQVLVNLVGNAVKFTEQGHVVIRATLDSPAPDGTGRIRLTVEDSGIGIDPTQLATLFEPFVQADVETTRRFGGSGLGLAISKQLVELMRGGLGAESAPGAGSRFWCTLPLAGNAMRPAQGPPPLDGIRILIVSDRVETAASLTAALRSWGAEPITATSVADACRADTTTPVEIALVDVRVADASGLWVDGALRTGLPRRTILLVAPQEAALRLCGDVDATIPLPWREQHLLDALRPGPITLAVESMRTQAVRVLVADDVEVNREVARQQLEQIGCSVDLAATGREAVELCREHPYDLVLMDCHMPELDGFEATASIRREPGPNQRTPIVALTASAFSEERDRCTASGMDEYLTKPISQRDLAACLTRHVSGEAPAATDAVAAADAPAEDSARPAVLDVEATLDRIGGNAALLTRLLGIFRRQTPPLLDELQAAIDGGDATQVRALAHKLKGSLRSVGGHAAQVIAARLEERAASGALDGAQALQGELRDELARLDHAMGSYLATAQGGTDG